MWRRRWVVCATAGRPDTGGETDEVQKPAAAGCRRSGWKRTDSELPDVDHAFVVLIWILGDRPGFRMRNQRATHVGWTRARMVRDVQGGCAGDMWCRHAR